MWPMLIMAGLQAVSNKDKEARDRKLASETQRYSPWTHLQAQPIEAANPIGDVAQGYGAYMGQQQNDKVAASDEALKQAQIGALNRKYSAGNATQSAVNPSVDDDSSLYGPDQRMGLPIPRNAKNTWYRDDAGPWGRAYNSRLGSNY